MIPLIGVVMPAYNSAEWIERAIDSVAKQTCLPQIRLVVVDDGSKDGTWDLLAKYQHYDWIKLIRRQNGGPGAARNAGIKQLSSWGVEYVAFLDSDDYWLPNRLERILQAIGDAANEAWTTNGFLAYEQKPTENPLLQNQDFYSQSQAEQLNRLLVRNEVFTMQVVLLADIEAVGGYDETLRYGEDWDLWIRLAKRGTRFRLLDEPLAVYTIRSSSATNLKSHENNLLKAACRWRILKAHSSNATAIRTARGAVHYRLLRKCLANRQYFLGAGHGLCVLGNLPYLKAQATDKFFSKAGRSLEQGTME